MINVNRLAQICLVATFLFGLLVPAHAEQSESNWDRVVFHLDTSQAARRALILARSYLDDIPAAKIVFVAYGSGVDFLFEDASDHRDDPYDYAVLRLIDRGVNFRICNATLSAREISKADLLEGVKIVPSGISEIARLQLKEGFAYLKP